MSERRQLINLTYRLLGSLAEAEDAVQETYARWYAMSRQQQDAIESPGAWLTTVASRICLNLLGSARARRERYVGEWIPEPLPERTEWISGRPGGTTADPADRVTLDESVSMAFLVVLESMTPAERVAFILHDVFRYPFAEVAEIVGRTPAACRQLASSARRRIRAAQAPAAPAARQAGVVRAFKQAWEAKDIDALIGLLDPDATAIADGGGLAATFLRPHRRRRADRARLDRDRQPGARRHDVPGTHRQRPARPGRPARRRHRDGVRVRRRRRPDQAHLGRPQPREAPALDDGLRFGGAYRRPFGIKKSWYRTVGGACWLRRRGEKRKEEVFSSRKIPAATSRSVPYLRSTSSWPASRAGDRPPVPSATAAASFHTGLTMYPSSRRQAPFDTRRRLAAPWRRAVPTWRPGLPDLTSHWALRRATVTM